MALVERLALLIEANAGQAIAEFKKVGAAARVTEAESGKAMGGLGQAGTVAGNLLKAGLVAAAAGASAALVKFGVDGVKAFVDVTGEVRKFNLISGATAEEGSRMVALFDVLGVSTDDASRAVGMLGKNIDVNATKLQAHGIEIAHNAAGNVDLVATLLNVGDAYKATEDPAVRAGLAAAAFGKSWQTMTPFLAKSREEIDKIFKSAEAHGLIFSQAQIDKGYEFTIATRELGAAFRGLEVQAGQALIPTLTNLSVAITNAIDSTHGGIGKDFIDLFMQSPVGAAVKGLGGLVNWLAGDEAGLAHEVAKATQEMTDQAKNADGLTKSLFSYESASRAVDAAVRSEAAAHRDLSDKQKTLSDLLKAGAVDQKAVASATRDVTLAERELVKARNDMADAATAASNAEQALADLRSGATAAKNMVDHADDLGKAQLRVHRAETGLTAAQDKLNVLQASGTATAADLANAADDVTQATYDLHDANANLITTQDTVNTLFQVGAENSPEVVAASGTVKDAHQKLGDATQHVADATQNVIDKQAALGTALAGDPNYDDKVRVARQNVADATQHVADAMYNVAQNKEKFDEATKALDVAKGAPGAVDQVRTNIEQLLAKKPDLAAFFDPMLADLHEAATILATPLGFALAGSPLGAVVNTGGLLFGGLGPGRAAGGPINGLSLVGEKGPELFAGHGTIIPNNMLSGGGGGSTTQVIQLVLDGKVITEVVHNGLLAKQRRTGNLGIAS
jgi:hypothetical protein